MVLEGLPVDVEDKLSELTHFFEEIDSGFDAANLVREGDWEYRSSLFKGNACFEEFCLVEGDVDCLSLGMVLGEKYMFLPYDEKLEGVGSVKQVLVVDRLRLDSNAFGLLENLNKMKLKLDNERY